MKRDETDNANRGIIKNIPLNSMLLSNLIYNFTMFVKDLCFKNAKFCALSNKAAPYLIYYEVTKTEENTMYTNTIKKNIAFFIIICNLLVTFPVEARQRPCIINYTHSDYGAANKNWAIGQDERGVMYFGNDRGLLENDGMEWRFHQFEESPLVRALAVKNHQTVYTGGDQELGRWDRDMSGKMRYTSLTHTLETPMSETESIWRVFVDGKRVIFQSFSHIYLYDGRRTQCIDINHGFLFMQNLNGEYWVQQMRGSLYTLQESRLKHMAGSEFLNGTVTRIILPYDEEHQLVGTSAGDMYLYDGSNFMPWNVELRRKLANKELNCGVYCPTRDTYLLGTMLDGVYEVDRQGNILNHYNTDNGLQNNTVLSIYVDSSANVWIALDCGLAYLRYIEGLSYYQNISYNPSAIYDAVEWQGALLIATNQGVFQIKQHNIPVFKWNPADKSFVNGTAGQVWSFCKWNNRLFCCHNNGIIEILPDFSIRHPFRLDNGVYKLCTMQGETGERLLAVPYNGLCLIEPNTNKVINLDQINVPVRNAQVDHFGNIWLETWRHGIYKCRLNADGHSFSYINYYNNTRDSLLPANLQIYKVGERIFFSDGNQFYSYNETSDKLEASPLLNRCFEQTGKIKNIVSTKREEGWAITDTNIYHFIYDGHIARIDETYYVQTDYMTLINNYENIAVLNDSLSLFCLDAGFILHNAKAKRDTSIAIEKPNIEYVHMGHQDEGSYAQLDRPLRIPYDENTVTVGFSLNQAFAKDLQVEYYLEQVDSTWSKPMKCNSLTYARLPEGKYKLRLRAIDRLGHHSTDSLLQFEVLPPWYRTIVAYLFYGIFAILLGVGIYLETRRRMLKKHRRQMHIRETEYLRRNNERLQEELEQKNAEIFTQSSFIIRKNELILKLKGMVDEMWQKNPKTSLIPLYKNINNLLDNNINVEDDWRCS